MGMSGDEQEFTEYVTARLPALNRLAQSLSGDPNRADDLVQKTITVLFARWPQVHTVERLDQYVNRMLVHAFIDEQRRPWTRVGLFRDSPERTAMPAPDVEERMVIRAALARVPARQRAVLVLRFLHDLPVAEVATLLNCSEGTVKSQTARGLDKLRELLREQNPTSTTPEQHDATR